MENNKAVMVKMYNGDFVMGTVDKDAIEDNATIVLNDPRNFIMAPTINGTVGVALRPMVAPFKVPRLEKAIEIRRDQVMFMLDESELDNDIVNGYKSEISGIKIASAAEAAKLASSTNVSPKEFII